MFVENVKLWLLQLQNQICQMLIEEDGQNQFIEDPWVHPEGGGGLTRVMADGGVIEKAGVNFSHVKGSSLVAAATARYPDLTDCPFEAMGVSVVIHPKNPYVPTTHANVRFIQVTRKDGSYHRWFGGGFDLTPYYGFHEDCAHWHQEAKAACEPYGPDVYPRFKQWADDYFYLKHRDEPRGIGGIFFDDLHEWGLDHTFSFVQAVGARFISAYRPILTRRKSHPFGKRERQFQCYRRGRYVEFNLMYDRGTLFGLQSGGRVESILMSLPPVVEWIYGFRPEPGSREAELYEVFLKRKNT